MCRTGCKYLVRFVLSGQQVVVETIRQDDTGFETGNLREEEEVTLEVEVAI